MRQIAVEQFLRDLTEPVLPGGRIEVQDPDDVESVLAPARRLGCVIAEDVLREHVERMMAPADQHGASALLRVSRQLLLLAGYKILLISIPSFFASGVRVWRERLLTCLREAHA